MSLFDGVPDEDNSNVTWFKFKEAAGSYSKDNPYEFEGELVSIQEREGKYGHEYVVKISDGENVLGVSSNSKMFANEVEGCQAAGAKPGDVIAFRYEGKVQGREAAYHSSRFMTAARAERIKAGAEKKAEKPASVGKIPF